jgi:polar amino acid transport system substrate-binding protein
MRTRLTRTSALLAIGTLLLACTAGSSGTPTSAPSDTSGASVSPTDTASASPDACAPENLKLVSAGKLTVGTDNPAFPPWYGGDEKAPWKISDPYSQKGYESAFVYALAEQLGFTDDQVTWVVVPFNNVIQPGAKTFDFDVNQVSYSADRAKSVDFSDSYYDVNQAVVALKSNPIASATSVADLKNYRLGAAVGTTSYAYIKDTIQPTTAARVYNDNDGAVKGLQAKQIDGIVVDLPTAFYMRDAQLTGGVIVGSLPTVGTQEYFGAVFQKGNPLVACVNDAIAGLRADGTLDQLDQEWIVSQGSAPELQP